MILPIYSMLICDGSSSAPGRRWFRKSVASGGALVWLVIAAGSLGCDADQNADSASTTGQNPAGASQRQPGEPETGDDAQAAKPLAIKPLAAKLSARPVPAGITDKSVQPDPNKLSLAKSRYANVVPRVTLKSWKRFQNLVYEANNMVMRGPRGEGGVYKHSGRQVAADWRRYARGVRGLFVLRDSLFSQQDHPWANDPYAPILPPNWVTAVAHRAAEGDDFEPPVLPEPTDDDGWQEFESPDDLFKDLPPSESLFEAATDDWARANHPDAAKQRARNARKTLRILDRDVLAMVEVMDRGAAAVAKVGAARITLSDRRYFGPELRRERIIPIFVENPTAHELDEGKGVQVPGLDVSDKVVKIVRQTIYRRRLQDGALAVERYDLSNPDERTRAISMLQELAGEDQGPNEPDTTIWLWVTGKLDPGKSLQREDARRYIPDFRRQLHAADIDLSRVALFSKPSVALADDDFADAFDHKLDTFNQLGIPMSVNRPTTHPQMHRLLCCKPPQQAGSFER